jgi:hypothetical protein
MLRNLNYLATTKTELHGICVYFRVSLRVMGDGSLSFPKAGGYTNLQETTQLILISPGNEK